MSTIRGKLVGVVTCAVLLAIAIATAASTWREAQRFAIAKRAELNGTAHVFASAVANDLAAGQRQQAYQKLRAIGRIPGITYARVDDLTGRRFAEIGAGIVLDSRRKTDLFSSLDLLFRQSVEVKVGIVKSGAPIGQLVIVADSSELRERVVEGLVSAGIAAMLAALIGIAVALRMQSRITGPIQSLTEAMAQVRQSHDFSTRVERKSDDETGIMVDAFNDMLAQIRLRDDHLARHRANLESTVEERTHDLRIAKEAAESANVAKSEFLATMSHEIRTPMNGMLVMAELISGSELAPRQQRYAEVIVKSGQSLLSIINDILDFSKIEAGSLELERIPVDPGEVIDDVLNLFWERAAGKGLDLAGYVSADVPALIEADPVRLNQVLSNLVNNALKFTETGHVCVIARKSPLQAASGDGVSIEFAVQDTGIGIPADKISGLFSAFTQADQSTTRKYGGTGLGLAICKKLVRAMGGDIAATSKEGEGSVFSFSLATRSLEEAGLPGAGATGDLRNALVALNGSITPKVIANYLRTHGIAVETIAPEALTSQACEGADAVFLTSASVPAVANGERPCLVCVSELGDSASDDYLRSGRAHDLLMRPVSRKAMHELIARLAKGEPLGLNATRRNSAAGVALPDFTGTRVLVADDSAVNREVIIEALSRLHIDPDVVGDGQAAIEAVQENDYDLVLMDCSMPVMDGFAATEAIRANEPDGRHLPIVALTAHVAGGPVDAWKRAGMDDCVTKPFTLKALAACIETWLPGAARETAADTTEASAPGLADRKVSPESNTPSETDPADDATPVIDGTVLEMLTEMGGDDSSELLDRVFGLYQTHGPQSFAALEQEMAGGDRDAIARAAHALKSMSYNVGAKRVGNACAELEKAARSNDDAPLDALLSGIADELPAALSRIAELRQPDGENAGNPAVGAAS